MLWISCIAWFIEKSWPGSWKMTVHLQVGEWPLLAPNRSSFNPGCMDTGYRWRPRSLPTARKYHPLIIHQYRPSAISGFVADGSVTMAMWCYVALFWFVADVNCTRMTLMYCNYQPITARETLSWRMSMYTSYYICVYVRKHECMLLTEHFCKTWSRREMISLDMCLYTYTSIYISTRICTFLLMLFLHMLRLVDVLIPIELLSFNRIDEI